MNDLDTALRTFYADRAADARSPQGLLDAVHRRGRQLRRRRILTGAAAALVLALTGGVAAIALPGRDEATQQLQVAMRAGSSATAPPSPVDTGWLPRGFPAPTVRLLGPEAWGLDTRRKQGLAALQVQIMPAKPVERTEPGTLSPIDVNGIRGSLYWVPKHPAGEPKWGNEPPEAEGPYAELVFQRKPGQWIRIVVQNSAGDVDLGITEDDLVRIAVGLVDRERPVPDAIRLGLLPGTVQWGQLTNEFYRTGAAFVDADAPDRPVDQNEQPNGHNSSVDSQVDVFVVPDDSLDILEFSPPLSPLPEEDPDGDGTFGTTRRPSPPVIAEDGSVYAHEDRTTALYRLRGNPKLVVAVQAKTSFGMSGAELLKVAREVRLGPDAAVKP